ncbi:MAG: homoserine dehydrogenase [Anaerolineales bacterium]
MPAIRLVFLGFGNVGQAMLRLCMDKRDELRQRFGIEWSTVGIITARHGSALDPRGIDPDRALAMAAAGESLAPLSRRLAPPDPLAFIHDCEADMLFENTPVNYADGQPAAAHLRAALERGMHAITANKGPVVHAYRELTVRAAALGRRFLFEATVMGGTPIFSVWRNALLGARLLSFRGILNSTTNLILSRMEAGSSFEEAVAQAQGMGIAETDPRGDTQGWDAAIKVAALVTVLMDQPLKPSGVARRGIEDLRPEDIASATLQGARWKLVCHAEQTPAGVSASVAPQMVDPTDPLFSVMGTSAAVTFTTDVLGPLTISESETQAISGPRSTAYGLLADMVSAVRGS